MVTLVDFLEELYPLAGDTPRFKSDDLFFFLFVCSDCPSVFFLAQFQSAVGIGNLSIFFAFSGIPYRSTDLFGGLRCDVGADFTVSNSFVWTFFFCQTVLSC